MSVDEAINRGNNLVATAIVALSGLAFLPEFFVEDKGPYKLDEGLLAVLGVAALVWYWIGRNRYKRSFVPVALVALGLAVKVIGFALEVGDADDVGDEYGALILLVLATVMVAWLYARGSRQTEASSQAGVRTQEQTR